MERAERLAALGRLARVGVALRVLGVVDRDEAVGAADGVAEQPSSVVAAAVSAAVSATVSATVRPCVKLRGPAWCVQQQQQ